MPYDHAVHESSCATFPLPSVLTSIVIGTLLFIFGSKPLRTELKRVSQRIPIQASHALTAVGCTEGRISGVLAGKIGMKNTLVDVCLASDDGLAFHDIDFTGEDGTLKGKEHAI